MLIKAHTKLIEDKSTASVFYCQQIIQLCETYDSVWKHYLSDSDIFKSRLVLRQKKMYKIDKISCKYFPQLAFPENSSLRKYFTLVILADIVLENILRRIGSYTMKLPLFIVYCVPRIFIGTEIVNQCHVLWKTKNLENIINSLHSKESSLSF